MFGNLDNVPGLAEIRRALGEVPGYLVGGAVRDLLLGKEVGDLDVAVAGRAEPVAQALGGRARMHERFGTASAEVAGRRVDLAGLRTESYERPGALPDVEPTESIAEDLGRRDFTVNAMAVPLQGAPELIDPFGGRADLDEERLRVLHVGSLRDDPTRALRAARYAARLRFEVDPLTLSLITDADLGTVSTDRLDAELRLMASEYAAPRSFRLASEWRLLPLNEDTLMLIERVDELARGAPWAAVGDRTEAILRAADPGAPCHQLAASRPASALEAVRLARGVEGADLIVARAEGADWLDDWVSRWREVRLEIDGGDLTAAGVPEGPAIGAGLDAALSAKLDGAVSGREQELGVALQAARG